MRIFLLLLICFLISSRQVYNTIKIKRNDLFLDKVNSQCFRYEDTSVQFIDDGRRVFIKDGNPFDTDATTEFELYVIFTSSKAVYYSKKRELYIGFAAIDNLLYATEPSSSFEEIDFYRLFYFGMKNPYDI